MGYQVHGSRRQNFMSSVQNRNPTEVTQDGWCQPLPSPETGESVYEQNGNNMS
jgi:hypothetical protein